MAEQGGSATVIPMPGVELHRYFVEAHGFNRTICIYVDAPSAEAAEAEVLARVGFKVKVTAK